MKFGNFDMKFTPYDYEGLTDENGIADGLTAKTDLYDFSGEEIKNYVIGFEVFVTTDKTPVVELMSLKSYAIDKDQNYHFFNYNDIEDESLSIEFFKEDYPTETKEIEDYLLDYFADNIKEWQEAKEIVEEVAEM